MTESIRYHLFSVLDNISESSTLSREPQPNVRSGNQSLDNFQWAIAKWLEVKVGRRAHAHYCAWVRLRDVCVL